jgi:hypothetical protein
MQQNQESDLSSKSIYKKGLCLFDPAYFIEEVLGYDCRPHHERILSNITQNRITLDLAYFQI